MLKPVILGLVLLATACVQAAVPEPATSTASERDEPAGQDRTADDNWSPSASTPHNPSPPRPDPPSLSGAERMACEANGGAVERRGRVGAEMCVQTYADAGRACTDESQCDGACIAEMAPATAGADVTGRCQADDRPFGCYALVEEGRATGGICVD